MAKKSKKSQTASFRWQKRKEHAGLQNNREVDMSVSHAPSVKLPDSSCVEQVFYADIINKWHNNDDVHVAGPSAKLA